MDIKGSMGMSVSITPDFCRAITQVLSQKGLVPRNPSLAQVVGVLRDGSPQLVSAFGRNPVAAFQRLVGARTEFPARSSFHVFAEAMIGVGIDVFEEILPPRASTGKLREPVTRDRAQRKWILDQINEIGERRLLAMAQAASLIRLNAYAPYSHYLVGAVILCQSGDVTRSCNSESVNYTLTDHAETGAITRAIGNGEVIRSGRRFIRAVVISHRDNSAPCGGCRQRIGEHCDNALVINADPNGKVRIATSMKELMPEPFTPTVLGIE